ncbi:NUDIX domain-containing protein [Treponema sp.]|uniref:NUDIX domain-containing protein n=1 Tax=Treponema sp. TaxID=166 RepID=UPI0025E1C4CF|nr:NUDIX domain-containing protein [Treponema sp.]MCR5219234.1 NUDIX domain-containing protein [Treponema sp.]
MSRVSVVCLCYHDGKVLVAHRNPGGQMGNRWEFPGGKVDGTESDEKAILREMHEEFDVDVKVLSKICFKNFVNQDVNLTLHVYSVEFPHDGLAKPFKLTEHTEYKWVNFNEIRQHEFVDSDYSILNDCRNFFEVN